MLNIVVIISKENSSNSSLNISPVLRLNIFGWLPRDHATETPFAIQEYPSPSASSPSLLSKLLLFVWSSLALLWYSSLHFLDYFLFIKGNALILPQLHP